jgi:adenylate cyclase
MSDRPVLATGGCLCGRIRYEAEVLLKSGYYCHCTICQRSTGQFGEMAIPTKAGTLKFLTDEPDYYVSSDYGKRAFCPKCGSRIAWIAHDSDLDWLTNVTVGSLDIGAQAEPVMHTFVETKMPWLEIADNLPVFKEDQVEELLALWHLERTGRPLK